MNVKIFFIGCFKTEYLQHQPSQSDFIETQQRQQHRQQQQQQQSNNNIWSNIVSSSTITSTLDSDDKRKIHKCDFPTCDKVYTKSSHLKAHKTNVSFTCS